MSRKKLRGTTPLPAPPVPTATPGRPPSLRALLASAGGVAGAQYLAEQLSAREGRPVLVRAVRDRLHHTLSVRKLGAGYYALDGAAEPVTDWLSNQLAQRAAVPVQKAVELILEHYPHGDRRAVAFWLAARPRGLRIEAGVVTRVRPRRK